MNKKADIWSAGCCFYHLLTGKKPYHQAKAIQVTLCICILGYSNRVIIGTYDYVLPKSARGLRSNDKEGP